MRKITLVCSGHKVNGQCNAEELLKVLQAIKPNVAFVEMHQSQFDFLYQQGNVEAHALTKYHDCKMVFVDRQVDKEAFFASECYGRVVDYVVDASSLRNDDSSVGRNALRLLRPCIVSATDIRLACRHTSRRSGCRFRPWVKPVT